jgi:hypothetical protein
VTRWHGARKDWCLALMGLRMAQGLWVTHAPSPSLVTRDTCRGRTKSHGNKEVRWSSLIECPLTARLETGVVSFFLSFNKEVLSTGRTSSHKTPRQPAQGLGPDHEASGPALLPALRGSSVDACRSRTAGPNRPLKKSAL